MSAARTSPRTRPEVVGRVLETLNPIARTLAAKMPIPSEVVIVGTNGAFVLVKRTGETAFTVTDLPDLDAAVDALMGWEGDEEAEGVH